MNSIRITILCITLTLLFKIIEKNREMYQRDFINFIHDEKDICVQTQETNHQSIDIFIHGNQSFIGNRNSFLTFSTIDHYFSHEKSTGHFLTLKIFEVIIGTMKALICISIGLLAFVSWVYFDLKRIPTNNQTNQNQMSCERS